MRRPVRCRGSIGWIQGEYSAVFLRPQVAISLLEDQVRAGLIDGQTAQFVHGQDDGLEVTLKFMFRPANGLCGRKRVDDVQVQNLFRLAFLKDKTNIIFLGGAVWGGASMAG